MRYVRPFSIDDLITGPAPQCLLGPEEGLGLTIRLHRGGALSRDEVTTQTERFALALTGKPVLTMKGQKSRIQTGDLAFIPPGASAQIVGGTDDVWAEIEAQINGDDAARPSVQSSDVLGRVIAVDPTRFEGGGFAYQSMIERKSGAHTMRINVLQVQPGSGSPDYHIHAFAQIYLIQEGEMSLDIGRQRIVAPKNSLVVLPAGAVHRNFNGGAGIERHISLLVPEPQVGQIFDFAVTIHDREAELMQELPASH